MKMNNACPRIPQLTAKKKTGVWVWIVLCVLSAFETAFIFQFSHLQAYGVSSSQSFLGIIITWIACYYVFKQKLYKHHILSLAIIAIETIIYYWIEHVKIYRAIKLVFENKFFVFLPFFLISSSLKEVAEHYVMTIRFTSPSIILLTEGISSLILHIISATVISSIPCGSDENILSSICRRSQWNLFAEEFTIIFDYGTIMTLYGWGYIVFGILVNYFRIYTNKLLSPTHRYMADVVVVFYWCISDIFFFYISPESKYSTDLVILRFFNSFILTIAVLFFNEYIIIRICGLHEHTFLEIDKRSQLETVIDFNIITEIAE